MDNLNRQRIILSVVVPVHNGAKFIEKTVCQIMKQDFAYFELLLVENGSTDDSMSLCIALEKKFTKVHVFHNEEKGTSLARKRGILEAKGKYITFSDQDDWYISDCSFSKMVQAIEQDGSQICQFGHYASYLKPFLMRKFTNCDTRMTREELLRDEILGIIGASHKIFEVVVWNKIYEANVLKAIAREIRVPLYFAEDMFLNVHAFFYKGTHVVSTKKEAYYVWNVGTGFSNTKQGAMVLFDEYNYVKPEVIRIATENSCTEKGIWQCHLETIYFMKSLVTEAIINKKSQGEILNLIKKLDGYEFVNIAKQYFEEQPTDKVWAELRFLSNKYTPEEYLKYCSAHIPKITVKKCIGNFIRSLKQ